MYFENEDVCVRLDLLMDQIRYIKELRGSIAICSGKGTATNKGETNFRNFLQNREFIMRDLTI